MDQTNPLPQTTDAVPPPESTNYPQPTISESSTKRSVFNIYLALFILLVLTAIATLIYVLLVY